MILNPFEYALGLVEAPGERKLWLYGEPEVAKGDVYHPWVDQAEMLRRKGCNVIYDMDNIGHDYDAVFVNCPKQHEQAEGLIAFALNRSKGFVMAAARGDAGGNRLSGMMEAYGLDVEQASKSRSKIVWTKQSSSADPQRITENLQHLLLRRIAIEGEQWWSVPGLFGWNKIDPGSRLLLQTLPADIQGKVADFGCGYGYLAVNALRRYPRVESIDAYDADARAVECCARNGGDKIHALWQDIRQLAPLRQYDAVIMNPPFHAGKKEDLALGQTFIRKAWESLRPQGRLFMVANRALPYEEVIRGLSVVYEGEGYKVLSGCAP